MYIYGTLNQADKGRRWAAVNTTIGTGIAGPADNNTAPTQTTALFALYNNSGVGLASGVVPPGRVIYPDYLKLIVTAAGTGAAGRLAFAIDTAQRGVTADSGTVKTNADTDALGDASANTSAATSISFLQFGNLTVSAASSKRRFVSNDYLFTRTLQTGDEILILFNQMEVGLGNSAAAAAASFRTVPIGLVTLGPGGLLLGHLYNFSAAPSFEYEAGWWELS
jgi:hypothetical protein